ncbi:MAG TPA: hypothetical protein VMV31_15320 [Terriglobales bacterium]|nr:hypothetical protein [Terriglobales bacterium]
MPPLRIALPASLRPAAEAAAGPSPQWLSPPLPADPRLRARWQRLWQERRAGAGGTSAEADAALLDPSVRALLLLLDQGADAALLCDADPGCATAWRLLEPRDPGGACADLWVGELDGAPLGWLDWPGTDHLSLAANQLRAAADELALLARRPAAPCLVTFAAGPDPWRRQGERLLATLAARTPTRAIALYSPFFFRDGRLLAREWWQAVHQQCPGALPLVCVPRLARAELAAALLAAGGTWAGPLRAGAEKPVARLAPDDAPARFAATLACLQARCA